MCITAGDKLNTKGIEDDDDDDDAKESVPVENESYVNFRKRMEKKTEIRAEEGLQENMKLCREFRRKPVTAFTYLMTFFFNPRHIYLYAWTQKNTACVLNLVFASLPGVMYQCRSRG